MIRKGLEKVIADADLCVLDTCIMHPHIDLRGGGGQYNVDLLAYSQILVGCGEIMPKDRDNIKNDKELI